MEIKIPSNKKLAILVYLILLSIIVQGFEPINFIIRFIDEWYAGCRFNCIRFYLSSGCLLIFFSIVSFLLMLIIKTNKIKE